MCVVIQAGGLWAVCRDNTGGKYAAKECVSVSVTSARMPFNTEGIFQECESWSFAYLCRWGVTPPGSLGDRGVSTARRNCGFFCMFFSLDDVKDTRLSNAVTVVHLAAALHFSRGAAVNLNRFSQITSSWPPIEDDPEYSLSHKHVTCRQHFSQALLKICAPIEKQRWMLEPLRRSLRCLLTFPAVSLHTYRISQGLNAAFNQPTGMNAGHFYMLQNSKPNSCFCLQSR